ncbi:hypothetical protein CC85DRAFT_289373 [Cutaneotrichosporon oleaginosum]|uniref:Uncharacterized protein n=1 Tax=Cutaneotrichosporon oleaginosum TaxID=879819 RepID=A0A0J0XBZ1_9TREE|nr:uncharacterized protein CC85DRAFT_289373 [Cutaneotrichosporon oleaginosum]KLT38591.1 hypothetical protein CC85DRAFT_289373 [Cutaneotrichosporon oleaginosum]TXT04405.1 hypothetical protein COLE_07224 [Cutaneotrichosporon oleaginosum]
MSLPSLVLARASRRPFLATRSITTSLLTPPRAAPRAPFSPHPLGAAYSTGPSRTYAALRQLHNSAPTARAPVPNPHSPLVPGRGAGPQPNGGSGTDGKKKNTQYGLWYGELFPGAMVPIFLLATAIFLSLSLLRTHLSNNRALVESAERIQQLESQLARLRAEAKRRQERERRERERILPIVVERVLQRVGAMNPEEELEVEEDVLLV